MNGGGVPRSFAASHSTALPSQLSTENHCVGGDEQKPHLQRSNMSPPSRASPLSAARSVRLPHRSPRSSSSSSVYYYSDTLRRGGSGGGVMRQDTTDSGVSSGSGSWLPNNNNSGESTPRRERAAAGVGRLPEQPEGRIQTQVTDGRLGGRRVNV